MVYLPAELALAEFSLLKGVSNVFHRMVDPGNFKYFFKYIYKCRAYIELNS